MAAFASGSNCGMFMMHGLHVVRSCLQVRELATRVKALKKIGEKTPFVAVELKK